MTSTLERELEKARAAPLTAQEMRQRLRAAVLVLVPNKWGLQGTLFRQIDHAPDAVIYAMIDNMRELVREP